MDREKVIELAREVFSKPPMHIGSEKLLAFAALIEREVRGDAEPVACIATNGALMWLQRPEALYSKPVPLFTHPAPAVVQQLVEATKRAMNYAENVVMAEGVYFDDDDDLPFIESALLAAKEAGL